MNNADYLQGFHDGKLKSELAKKEAINYLNHDIQYFTIYDNKDEPTPSIIININEFKKLIEILKK